MSKFTKAALLAALIAGTAGTLATPAFAKKEEAPAGPTYKTSDAFRKAAVPVQDALKNNDIATAEAGIPAVRAVAKGEDEIYLLQGYDLSIAAKKASAPGGNETILAGPLDALIVNPRTPKTDVARFSYLRGTLSYNGKQYKQALDYFIKARDAGYQSNDLPLQMANAQVESGDIAGGVATLDKVIDSETAAGRAAPEAWYRFGIAKLNAAKAHQPLVNEMVRYIKAYPNSKTWRDVLISYGFEGNSVKLDKQQRLDLFRLMRAANALDQAFYEEYAQTAVDVGLPDEAVTVVKAGRASGKLPATGGALILGDAQKALANDRPLSVQEKGAQSAPDGNLPSQVGDGYLGTGNYAKAIELYNVALAKGPPKVPGKNAMQVDAVQTHLGIAKSMTGDKAGAQAAFATVSGNPRNEIAQFWSLYTATPPVAAPAAK